MMAEAETESESSEVAVTREGDAHSRFFAHGFLRPAVQAALTLKSREKELGNVELMDLMEALQEQVEAAQLGDLRRAEEMLMVQAHTLDRIFNKLLQNAAETRRASHLDLYMKLWLRAQSQCRATLGTLAVMKNPRPVAFVGQNNIAGIQQVNNGVAPEKRRQAQENGIAKSKVLEKSNEQRLDTGTTSPTGTADSTMETVAPLNRTKVGYR